MKEQVIQAGIVVAMIVAIEPAKKGLAALWSGTKKVGNKIGDAFKSTPDAEAEAA